MGDEDMSSSRYSLYDIPMYLIRINIFMLQSVIILMC